MMELPNHTRPQWPGRVPVPLRARVKRWLRGSSPEPRWLVWLRKSHPDFLHWSVKEASCSDEGAAAFFLGLLRDDWRMSAAFPRVLAGGNFGYLFKFLTRSKFDTTICEAIGRAVAKEAANTVLNVYLHDARLQAKLPDALLPSGKLAFLKWLCSTGLKRGTVSICDILWFMQQGDEEPGQNLRVAYLIRPEWQERFPDATTTAGWNRFANWCRTQEFGFRPEDRMEQFRSGAKSEDKIGINVLGHFCFESGLQQAARHTVDALTRAGASCVTRDIPVTARTRMSDRTAHLGLEVHPVTLVHFTPNPFYHEAFERAGLRKRAGVYRIGLCSWELPQIPAEWLPANPQFDEIWAYTRFIADAMGAYGIPVRHVLPGVRLPSFTPVSRAAYHLPDDVFLFMFLFDMCSVMERKNPLGLIRAFRLAFAPNERVALAIKVSHADQDPANLALLREACAESQIHLIEQTMDHPQTCALLNCCDAYASLHRCEGFGLTMAEAMLLGKPVVATGYSGNMDFMSHENSLLVKYKPAIIERDFPNYPKGGVWSEPDIDDSAGQMRWLFDHPREAVELGKKARSEMETLLSIEAAGDRMMKLLRPILHRQESMKLLINSKIPQYKTPDPNGTEISNQAA